MEQKIIQTGYDYLRIPDYHNTAGVLAEFDPNIIMCEISQDVNNVINRAINFLETDSLGEEELVPFKNTTDVVSRLLAEYNHELDHDSIISYGQSMRKLGSTYLDTLAEIPNWISHYPKWVGGRYANDGRDVEIIVSLNQVKFPNLTDPELQRSMTPQLAYMVNQLLGFSDK